MARDPVAAKAEGVQPMVWAAVLLVLLGGEASAQPPSKMRDAQVRQMANYSLIALGRGDCLTLVLSVVANASLDKHGMTSRLKVEDTFRRLGYGPGQCDRARADLRYRENLFGQVLEELAQDPAAAELFRIAPR